MNTSKRQTILTSLVGAIVLTGSSAATLADDIKLPRSMVWSAYDLGSSGYAEASGIANALQKKHPTRIRIVPAGTSIGRLLPMATGKVKYGYLANEVFFAAEGTYDFADLAWGPQDLRIVLGRPATVGLAVAKELTGRQALDPHLPCDFLLPVRVQRYQQEAATILPGQTQQELPLA